MARRVTDPAGRRWRVRRRWLPWEPKVRLEPGFSFRGSSRVWDALAEWAVGPVTVALAILAAVIGGFVLAVITPLLFTAAEVFLAVLLVPAFVVFRIVLRTPWILVATTSGPPSSRVVRGVSGWRESEAALDLLADQLRLGQVPGDLPPPASE